MERMLINAGLRSIDDISELFNSTPAVSSLIVHGNKITSLHARAPLQLPELKILNLSSNELHYVDCGDLGGCPLIESLDLAANQIAGIRGLSTLRKLKQLNLSYNQLTDLRWLQEVAAPSNSAINVVDSGDGSRVASKVTKLDLRDNNISDTSELFNLRHLPLLRDLKLQVAEFERPDGSVHAADPTAWASRGATDWRVTSSESNSVCGKPTYLPIILATCPNLQYLDGLPVSRWRDVLEQLGTEQHQPTGPLQTFDGQLPIAAFASTAAAAPSTPFQFTSTPRQPNTAQFASEAGFAGTVVDGHDAAAPAALSPLTASAAAASDRGPLVTTVIQPQTVLPSSSSSHQPPTPHIDLAASRFLKRYLGNEGAAAVAAVSASSSTAGDDVGGGGSPARASPARPLASTSPSSPPPSSSSLRPAPPSPGALLTHQPGALIDALQHEMRIEHLETRIAMMAAVTGRRAGAALGAAADVARPRSESRDASTSPIATRTASRLGSGGGKGRAPSSVSASVPPEGHLDVDASQALADDDGDGSTTAAGDLDVSGETKTSSIDQLSQQNQQHAADGGGGGTGGEPTTSSATEEGAQLVSPASPPATPEPPLLKALRRARAGPGSGSGIGGAAADGSDSSSRHALQVPSPHDFGSLRGQLEAVKASHEASVQEVQALKQQLVDAQGERDRLVEEKRTASDQATALKAEVDKLKIELESRPSQEAVDSLRSRLAEASASLAVAPSREVVEALQARLSDYSEDSARLQAKVDEERRAALREAARAEEAVAAASRAVAERESVAADLARMQSELATARSTVHRERELRERTEEAGRLSQEQLASSAASAMIRARDAEVASTDARARLEEAVREQAKAAADAAAAKAESEHLRARFTQLQERATADLQSERDRASTAVQAAEQRLLAARSAAEDEVRRVTQDANARLGAARDALEQHAAKHAATSKALSDARTEVGDLQRRLAAAHVDIVDKDKRLAGLRDDLAAAERERNAAVAGATSSLTSRITELVSRIDDAEANARTWRGEAESAQASLSHTRNEVKVKEVQMADAQETIRKLKREMAASREEAASGEAGYKQAVAELRAQLDDIMARIEAAYQARDDALEQAAASDAAASGARKVSAQLEGVVRELRSEAGAVEGLRKQLSEKEAALSFIEREVAGVKATFDARVAALTGERDAALRSAHEAKAQLQPLQEAGLAARSAAEAARAEVSRLADALAAAQQSSHAARARVAGVESEMRVLLQELDATRARASDQARRMAAWLGQMQAEVAMGDSNNNNNINRDSGGMLHHQQHQTQHQQGSVARSLTQPSQQQPLFQAQQYPSSQGSGHSSTPAGLSVIHMHHSSAASSTASDQAFQPAAAAISQQSFPVGGTSTATSLLQMRYAAQSSNSSNHGVGLQFTPPPSLLTSG